MLSCPPLQVLRRVGSSPPGSATDHSLDSHINHCPHCQYVLDGLTDLELVADATGSVDPDKLPRIPGFRLERELGRGGMGVVFLARELHPDREVAVKFLPSGPLAAARDRDRWLKEARAAARVRDPHIVQLYRVDEADGWLYLVLEYLAGGSLKDRLTGPLPPRVAAALLVPVARAIEQLHRVGVWHLDLKPANILIDAPPGTPLDRAPLKITDFGIARSQDDAGVTGSLVGAARGTLLYMAPEQLAGRRSAVGPAADIYALGVILYELLAARPPFLSDSDAETIRRVLSDDPMPPRRLNPAIPRDLQTICLKCLEKDAGRRYASAEALAADLCRFLDGHPILARAVSKPEHLWRWIRRKPVVASLAGFLALSLSVGFVAVVLLWRFAEAERKNALADFRTTCEVLSQAVEWSATNPLLPEGFDQQTLLRVLEQTRNRVLGIVVRRPDDLVTARQLAVVDKRLGYCLVQASRWDDAQFILDESVDNWERISRLARLDRAGRISRIWALRGRAEVAEHQHLNDEEIYLHQALVASEELERVWPDSEAMGILAGTRYCLARLLVIRDQGEQARSLLAANRRLFEKVNEDDLDRPELASWRVFVELDVDHFTAPSSPLPLTLAPVDRSDVPDAVLRLANAQAGLLPARAWAELALSALRSRGKPNTAPSFQSAAGLCLSRHLLLIAAEQRRLRKIDDARVTVERMLALGKLLVERFPDIPTSHLALSEAYINLNKNAWRTDDSAGIMKNLRLSLDSARRALALDPNNADARYLISAHQRRLDRLLAPPEKAEDPDRGVQLITK